MPPDGLFWVRHLIRSPHPQLPMHADCLCFHFLTSPKKVISILARAVTPGGVLGARNSCASSWGIEVLLLRSRSFSWQFGWKGRLPYTPRATHCVVRGEWHNVICCFCVLAGADHAKVLDEHVSKFTELAKETAANVSKSKEGADSLLRDFRHGFAAVDT